MARHVERAIRMKKQEVARGDYTLSRERPEGRFQRQAMPLLRVNNTRRGDSPRW